MEATTAPVVPGYAMGALLGRGSSATVWAARRIGDGRPVAIKVVPGAAGVHDAGVRELGVLRGVRGEHLVALVDAVPVRDPEGLALVMERFDGGSLAQVVAARGRLTDGEVVTVLSPVAAALGSLHAQGIVHGDVAPGNVLFDASGRPALADLGLARIVGERSDEAWGTEGFVAPEVVTGSAPTPASDVYAVGALAWLAVTGGAPGPSYLRPSAATLTGVDPAVAAIMDRCLAADPGARPDAVEAANALYAAAPAEPLRLPGEADAVASLTRRIRAAAAEPAPDPHASRGHRGRRMRAPRRRSRGRSGGHRGTRRVWPGLGVALVVTAVLGTVAGLVAIAAGWDPRPVARAAASADPGTRSAGAPAKAGPTPSRASGTAGRPPTPRSTSAPASRSPSQPAPRSASAPAPSSRPGTPPLAVLRDRDALRTDPVRVAGALAEVRAGLWTAVDPARVTDLDAPGSRAARADREVLTTARSGGWRYDGVRFTVRSATLEAMTPARAASPTRATLHVVLDSPAYVVHGPSGRETRPERLGRASRLRLVWTAAGWRVEEVTAG